jgi:hypothetical protein
VGAPGVANGYTEADEAGRQAIYNGLRDYIQGYFYFLQNDPRVPELVQNGLAGYGLAKDEFVDNGGWPYRFYLREGRRMIGDWVMTQDDISSVNPGKADLVSFGGFPVDSHQVYIYPTPDGKTTHDGKYLTRLTPGTYEISYRVLLPKREEITNLLCPYATSSSSVAYNGFRMVPSWMMLGQAAGAAAALAADQDLPVQDLNVTELQDWLIDNNMLPPRYDWPVSSSGEDPGTGVPDIIIDNTDDQTSTTGQWLPSTFHDDFIGENYWHDDDAGKGSKAVTYTPELPQADTYKIMAHWAGGSNRAENALYEITHAGGVREVRVDQTQNSGQWIVLAELQLDPATAQVTLRNDDTNGVVIADAVGFAAVPD